MLIKKIKLKNYRNYKNIEVNFDNKINIIYGNNAVGKTNLLESIFLTANFKSHKNSKDLEIINFEEKTSYINLILEKNNKIYEIDVQLNKERKKALALNKNKQEKIIDYIGFFNVVMFAPEDLSIIKEGPNLRRKFLDMELCQIDKIYLKELTNYNHTLKQRNILLKDIKHSKNNKNDLIEILHSLNEILIRSAITIIIKRYNIIYDIKKIINDIHKEICDNKENLIIDYENNVYKNEEITNIEKLKNKYNELLIKSENNDIENEFTYYGPHRDDISFLIDNNDIRKFGSQGQKKIVAISLKLSELELLKRKIKDNPILLLDDVFSELDEKRQKKLVEYIKDTQTIITCTGIKRNVYELLKPATIYHVFNNNIIKK